MKHARLEQKLPPFSYLKHLQTVDPSFVIITKPLNNKRGETSWE